MLKNIVEYVVKSLVDNPGSVSVTEKSDDSKIILEVHVDEKERGKIIGKEGKTIRSIRALVHAIDPKDGRECIIEIAK